MANSAAAHAELCRLRRDIARMEGRLAEADRLVLPAAPGAACVPDMPGTGKGRRLPLGLPRLDRALGGGILLAALHEIRAEETRDGAAAAGFALALLSCLAAARQPASALPEKAGTPALLWISVAETRREVGDLYAPGLLALGLDPARLIRVAVRTQAEALWAFEAALSCRGLLVAVCELRRPSLDLTATRRCAMRAREGDVTGLFLRFGAGAEPSAAETRFRLSPWPAGEIDGFAAGVGRMTWRLALEKNRGGRIGLFTVEWNAHERSFAEPVPRRRTQPHPQPVAAASADRPADPRGDAGERIWRRAS